LINGAVVEADGNGGKGGQVAATPVKNRGRATKKRKVDDAKDSAAEAEESVAADDNIKEE
jgi:hypothetical protein